MRNNDTLTRTSLEILTKKYFGEDTEVKDFGMIAGGNINSTYYVEIEGMGKVLLQAINQDVFTEPNVVMDNIKKVTDHFAKKGISDKTIELINSIDGKHYIVENDVMYRFEKFIDNAITKSVANTPHEVYVAAKEYGAFVNNLSDFDPSCLDEIIKDFHNTQVRYETFQKITESDCGYYPNLEREQEARVEIDFIRSFDQEYSRIVKLLEEKKIPMRVTHNDTKLENLMFLANGENVVIDLDTVMPGSLLYDMGDFLRSFSSTTNESNTDYDSVAVDYNKFQAGVRGYLESVTSMTEIERHNIVTGTILITLELGMRFIGDYINNDAYFGAATPKINLERGRNQLALASFMIKNQNILEKIVTDTYLDMSDDSVIEQVQDNITNPMIDAFCSMPNDVKVQVMQAMWPTLDEESQDTLRGQFSKTSKEAKTLTYKND